MVVSGTCGTRYVENPGTPSYLENTVVIQNEPGIQEVRTTPSVRGLSGVRGDVGHWRPAPSPSDVVSLPSFLCVCLHALDVQYIFEWVYVLNFCFSFFCVRPFSP